MHVLPGKQKVLSAFLNCIDNLKFQNTFKTLSARESLQVQQYIFRCVVVTLGKLITVTTKPRYGQRTAPLVSLGTGHLLRPDVTSGKLFSPEPEPRSGVLPSLCLPSNQLSEPEPECVDTVTVEQRPALAPESEHGE